MSASVNQQSGRHFDEADQDRARAKDIRNKKRRKKKLRHRLSQTQQPENDLQQVVHDNLEQKQHGDVNDLHRSSQHLVQEEEQQEQNEEQQEQQQQPVLHQANKPDEHNVVAQSKLGESSVRSRVQFLKDKLLPKQEPVAMHRHFTFNAIRGVVAVPLKSTEAATSSSPPIAAAAADPEAVVIIEYTKDPIAVVSRTEQFLQRYLKATATAAADYYCVFDVDDTMMFGTDNLISVHPLGRVLYDMCARLGFDIAVITARSGTKASVAYLRDQLSILGYTGYSKVCMASSEHQNDASPALCKVMSRRELGKPVILNVGNLTSDLFLMCDSNSVLANLNPHTYYFLKGHDPDILCLKLPTY